jgi:hypothetical protein
LGIDSGNLRVASGEETIHRSDEILGRNRPGAAVEALGIANYTPG